MKNQFVGGILVRECRVLLTKNTTVDSPHNGLWSLPTGDVKESESRDRALVRVLATTVGLEVSISRKLTTYETGTSETVLFVMSEVGFSRVHESPVQECEFFAFDELPEHILIESLLCIVRYQILESALHGHPFNVIDRVFASIFYSRLAPHFGKFGHVHEIEVYRYVVLSTPYRKFKSVVPFLISGCNHEMAHLFLIPELCFAVWTLLDDCHDETSFRYGRESVLLKFGKGPSMVALFTSLHDMKGFLDGKISPSNGNNIIAALVQSAAVLLQRGRNGLDTDINTYLNQSSTRTEFLRAAWVSVLEESDYDPAKCKILYDIQRCSSRIGQLINDYFDIDRGQLQDFDRTVASAHWLLLAREARGDDSDLLRALWSESEGGREKYVALLKKYEINRVLSTMIKDSLVRIITSIREAELDKDEKAVLIAWHHMSLIHFSSEVHDAGQLAPFLESVENLILKY